MDMGDRKKRRERKKLAAVLKYLADTTPPAAPADTSYDTRVLSSTLWRI